MNVKITGITETTVTVWREGKRTRWNRLRLWLSHLLESIGIRRTRRRLRAGDVIEVFEGTE